MDLKTLPALTALSDKVTIVEIEQIKVVRIIHEKAIAGIALHGGHVVSYKPAGQEDLIWMSKKAIYDGKTALRGGVPVCWPWFGRIASPAHGFARVHQWSLIQHRENDHGVIIELGLNPSLQSLDIWPFQFNARLIIEVGDELQITLDITNTDDKSWTFSGALHTYLNVSDVRNTTIIGVGPEYFDSLQDSAQFKSSNILQLTSAIDRVYTKPESHIHLQDSGYGRRLGIENQGHNSAVLWNPWRHGATNIQDMTDDGYLTMMCIESSIHAATIEQGKELKPGDSHQLKTKLSVH
ncbi:D-hexose-6-phosphate mutarotase [Vibrio pectenicida]|uniref:D-hexose-6-phosphate mutarotase n=1 Tax=Vibrio pectenicida TaxID=62763 RepID=UPI003081DE31